jgi:hypothetical protein
MKNCTTSHLHKLAFEKSPQVFVKQSLNMIFPSNEKNRSGHTAVWVGFRKTVIQSP